MRRRTDAVLTLRQLAAVATESSSSTPETLETTAKLRCSLAVEFWLNATSRSHWRPRLLTFHTDGLDLRRGRAYACYKRFGAASSGVSLDRGNNRRGVRACVRLRIFPRTLR